MSKKISEWLEELPEPQKTEAIQNWEVSEIYLDKDFRREDSLYHALCHAFIWGTTPQGHEYWLKFSEPYYKEFYKLS